MADKLTETVERLLEALTPTGETKAAYMGEFSWTEWLPDKDGVEQGHERVVPWTTIKEIMAAIRERADVDQLDEADALAALSRPNVDEVERLQTTIAAAYQIVGTLADAAGVYDHPDVIAVMDGLSDGELPEDILPWPKTSLAARPNLDEMREGLLERATVVCDILEEDSRKEPYRPSMVDGWHVMRELIAALRGSADNG